MKSRIRSRSISGFSTAVLFNGRFSFVLLMVLGSLLLVTALARPSVLTGARVTTTDMISPVLSFFSEPFQKMAATVGGVSGVASLRAENAQLKSENIRLKEWYQTALMLQAENQSLQELLNLRIDTTYHYKTGRVLSDAGNAFVKTILIALGKRNNVKKNQAVLAGEGMIGRVIEVGNKTSRVLLLSDINSRIPVLVEGSRQKAILAGNNTSYPVLRHLPQDAGVVKNSRVVTSGDGGVFPPGLPIGRIVEDSKGNIIVKPYAETGKITYVRILDNSSDHRLVIKDSETSFP